MMNIKKEIVTLVLSFLSIVIFCGILNTGAEQQVTGILLLVLMLFITGLVIYIHEKYDKTDNTKKWKRIAIGVLWTLYVIGITAFSIKHISGL